MINECGQGFEGPAGLVRAHDTAAEVLGGLLKTVQRGLRRLKKRRWGERRAQGIHQLRVVCRRSEAALWVFKGNLKRRRRREMRRTLQRVRRAAGGVRACDVMDRLLLSVFDAPRGERLAALEWAQREVGTRRRGAVRQFKRQLKKTSWKGFRTQRRKALKSVRAAGPGVHHGSTGPGDNRWRSGGTEHANVPILIDVASELLPPLVDQLLSMSGDDLRDPLVLHQMRIHSKRLRYSLEILGPCLPGEMMRRVQPAMEALTGRLGAINDTFEACELVRSCCTDAQRTMETARRRKSRRAAAVWPHLRTMAESLDARLRAQRDEFLQWWRSTLADDVLGVIEREASRLTPVSALREEPVAQEQPA